jgi:hypothetical protein
VNVIERADDVRAVRAASILLGTAGFDPALSQVGSQFAFGDGALPDAR